jgi:hypothetical protein
MRVTTRAITICERAQVKDLDVMQEQNIIQESQSSASKTLGAAIASSD